MDLRQLRYFKEIAEQGGFSAAANVLHVAQSALSRQVRLLEDECGGPLFERSAQGTALTPAGTLLLERARLLLHQAEAARVDVRAENEEPSGLVRLGTTPSVASVMFAPLASRFLARFPRVRMQLVETITPDPVALLARGDVDLAIGMMRSASEPVTFRPLFREPMCLFGPPGDALLEGGGTRKVEALLDIPLIVPVGVGWLPMLRPLLGDRIGRIRPRVEVVSVTCAEQMVAAKLGYGVVPLWTVADAVAAGRFSAARLEGFSLQRGLALPHDRPVGRIVLALAKAIEEQAAAMIAEGTMEEVGG